MKPTKNNHGPGPVRKPVESTNFSVRIHTDQLVEIQKEAALAGMSTNQWFVQSAVDAVEMSRLPAGQELPLPKAVAIARYLRHSKPVMKIQ